MSHNPLVHGKVNDPSSPLHNEMIPVAVNADGSLQIAKGAPVSLEPSATWGGSTVTLDATGMALGAAAAYAGGILVTNLDASITIYVARTLAELGAAATRYPLIPGVNASVVIPVASPASIFAKGASGAPLLGFLGAS